MVDIQHISVEVVEEEGEQKSIKRASVFNHLAKPTQRTSVFNHQCSSQNQHHNHLAKPSEEKDQ